MSGLVGQVGNLPGQITNLPHDIKNLRLNSWTARLLGTKSATSGLFQTLDERGVAQWTVRATVAVQIARLLFGQDTVAGRFEAARSSWNAH